MFDGLYVFEEFYENPDEVRDYALTLDFNVKGNYPGLRTDVSSEEHHSYLRKFFEDRIIKQNINFWPDEYNTSFQYTTEKDKTWIHHDETEWAGILYLTPGAPVESGTSFYKHKDTGVYLWNGPEDENLQDCDNVDDWEEVAYIGNLYNRLVVYKGGYYHRSKLAGFGTDKHSGRLFQTFFFNTSNVNMRGFEEEK